MPAKDEVLVDRHDAVLLLTLNRPESRNALTADMMAGLGEAVLEAEQSPGIRALVLTGSGDRAFCSGMDLRNFAAGKGLGPDADSEVRDGFRRLMDGTAAIPVVGAANGAAVAGGFELLLGCDVIVASSATTFGLPEVKRGLFPGGPGMYLGTRIPLSVALEMALTGDPIDARRAYELGLINAVVEPEQVLPTALGLAERIAANGPLAVAAVKELVRLFVTDERAGRERFDHWQPKVYGSLDAKEGATAFIERRDPVWQGQ